MPPIASNSPPANTMEAPMSIWNQTYHHHAIKGLPDLALLTAVNEDTSKRWLVAELSITQSAGAINLSATASLTPAQMRELGVALIAQARRVENDLIPLLHPEPELIPFQLYHEPEEVAA
jgi:hypothetical protein